MQFKSEVKLIYFHERNKTPKNNLKKNLKQHLLQNDQSTDTTLLHSYDEMTNWSNVS